MIQIICLYIIAAATLSALLYSFRVLWLACKPVENVSKKLYGMDQETINKLLEKETK